MVIGVGETLKIMSRPAYGGGVAAAGGLAAGNLRNGPCSEGGMVASGRVCRGETNAGAVPNNVALVIAQVPGPVAIVGEVEACSLMEMLGSARCSARR